MGESGVIELLEGRVHQIRPVSRPNFRRPSPSLGFVSGARCWSGFPTDEDMPHGCLLSSFMRPAVVRGMHRGTVHKGTGLSSCAGRGRPADESGGVWGFGRDGDTACPPAVVALAAGSPVRLAPTATGCLDRSAILGKPRRTLHRDNLSRDRDPGCRSGFPRIAIPWTGPISDENGSQPGECPDRAASRSLSGDAGHEASNSPAPDSLSQVGHTIGRRCSWPVTARRSRS